MEKNRPKKKEINDHTTEKEVQNVKILLCPLDKEGVN